MKKTLSRKLLSLVISGGFISGLFSAPLTLAASFFDVSQTDPYFKAIYYLADAGIIQGYADGTFKPDQQINRAEFLKLLMESSNIVTDVNAPSGFTDVDENAWYAKYIRKAKEEGWIQGYSDNTFKPAQNINKAEALKIIAKVQGWETGAVTAAPFLDVAALVWFAPYVDYAKARNYLEETGKYYIPDAFFSRGQVSEVLFRIYVTAENNALIYKQAFADSIEIKPDAVSGDGLPEPFITPPPPLDFEPYSAKTYSTDYFEGAKLAESFPNNFYLNEVYTFEGQATEGRFENVFIFLAPQTSSDTSQFVNYIGEVNSGSFKVPVIFRKPGNYRLGLILGNSGESKVAYISVLPQLPPEPLNDSIYTPSSQQVTYKDTRTTFSWDNGANTLSRLTVYQGNKTSRFFFRQNTESFDVDYIDFRNFNEGKVYFRVEGAQKESSESLEFKSGWTVGPTQSFTAVTHTFSKSAPDLISVSALPEYFTEIKPIKFSGTTATDIYSEAIVTKPDGSTVSVKLQSSKPYGTYLGSSIISSGNDYSFAYSPSTAGTYIVEVNGKNGEAVINTPVYMANGIPLIPDFFDLNKLEQKEVIYDLPAMRTELLNLINADRTKAGLQNIKIDSALNNLAQAHSEDMVDRNFFGHINPDGESPNDRRIEAGITTTIGENLAQAPTILYAHYGLMRSGIHRQNILDASWTRVGLGIAQDEYGQLLVTEEFSHDPLTEDNLNEIEGKILDLINKTRSEKDIPLVEPDQTLTSIANDWSKLMADQNFFDFVSPDGESLSSIVREKVPNKAVQAVILQSNSESKLYDEILLGNDVTENQWRKIGIGLKVDNKGEILATLLYTTM